MYAKSLADKVDIFSENDKHLGRQEFILSLCKGRKRMDESGKGLSIGEMIRLRINLGLTSVESSVSGVSGPSLS